ncbi:MAG: hypothetical protein QM489_07810 [Candidatus Izemoplasma sp.]
MARQKKSALPKIISKANREISTLIESDIAQESLLLQKLVEDVLKANMEIKKSNNQRINESKEKLEILDKEIAKLSKAIDNVDRETIILQLNEMIDIENQIFDANNIVRFFEHNKQQSNLKEFDRLFKEFELSLDKTEAFESIITNNIKQSNSLFFDTQINISHEIINEMNNLFIMKSTAIESKQESIKEIDLLVTEIFDDFSTKLRLSHEAFVNIKQTTTSVFSADDNEIFLAEQLEESHITALKNIENSITLLRAKFDENILNLQNDLNLYEESVNAKIVAKNRKQIEKEALASAQREANLKSIRLLIINAEKNKNNSLTAKLLEKYAKAEKVKIDKVTTMTKKLTNKQTKKMKIKTINQMKVVEAKFTSDLSKLSYNLELENISFDESKVLYKINSDNLALIDDKDLSKQLISNIEQVLKDRFTLDIEVSKLRESMRDSELNVMFDNEILELSIYPKFRKLLITLKEVEYKRISSIKEALVDQELMAVKHQFQILKSKAEIKFNDDIQNIDKAIVKLDKETFIKNSKLQEEAASEIIYQESLIKIAQKEHELQLLKVESLHENERALAEEQVARINLGVKVNDAFIKTTLESQLLFASQQINCAKSEYDIRIESVSLTLNQELDYANKKLDYLRQKYDYDKNKLQKELASKLEDLNYKLVLFTDQKDNKNTQLKINELEIHYDQLVKSIQAIEDQDEDIARYTRVVQEASKRAEDAILDAEQLRETTIDSFQDLHNKTKAKYDTIKETKQTEETKGLLPVMNNPANDNADERLRQATLEAERLYKEKIDGPTTTIEQTKEQLETNISTVELDNYTNSQKAIKNEIRETHIILIQKYQDDLDIEITPVLALKDIIANELANTLAKIPETLFSQELYRTKKDIKNDYTLLLANNKAFFKNKKMLSEKEKFQDSLEVSQTLKEILTLYSLPHKPYKVYIKYASKGLNARKKELNKKYKKNLKKELSVLEVSFRKKINEL